MEKPPKEYRQITSPFYNVKVFDYWGDIYESVFILLKPFFRFKSNSQYNTETIQDFRLNWTEIILSECDPITWNEVMKLGGFKNLAELDDGLRIKNEYAGTGEKMRRVTDKYQILYPYDDVFSPYQIHKILKAIKNLGYNEVILGSEFPDQDNPIKLILDDATIEGQKEGDGIYKNVYTADKRILFSCAFDLFYTFICGDRIAIDKIIKDQQFEGFYCELNTNSWWSSNYPVEELE